MISRRTHLPKTLATALAFSAVLGLSAGMPGVGTASAATPPGAGAGVGSVSGSGGSTKVVNGTYQIRVGGYYTTTDVGTASVGSGKVHISAPVVDESGSSGMLRADVDLVQNRFKGTGTVLGLTITVEGRVDAADQRRTKVSDAQILGRVVATFVDSASHHGRIAGQPNHSAKPG